MLAYPRMSRQLTLDSTIHGMVYNAMKLFMEINPQLFDDCSQDYTEHQNGAEARKSARDMKWQALVELANRNKAAQTNGRGGASARQLASVPGRIDEVDTGAEESREKLDGLKLGQERERRPQHDRQGSVGSSRSQR